MIYLLLFLFFIATAGAAYIAFSDNCKDYSIPVIIITFCIIFASIIEPYAMI